VSYFQIIEVESPNFEALNALHEQWLADTEGQRTTVREWLLADRDRPGTYLMIVEFPSVEAAAINNDLPATGRIAEGLAALSTAPMTFRNLDLLRHD
jgi:hypothetical protein